MSKKVVGRDAWYVPARCAQLASTAPIENDQSLQLRAQQRIFFGNFPKARLIGDQWPRVAGALSLFNSRTQLRFTDLL